MTRREMQRKWREYQKFHRAQETVWSPRISHAITLQARSFVKVMREKGAFEALATINQSVTPAPIRSVLTRLYRTIVPRYANITAKGLQEQFKDELKGEAAEYNIKAFGTPNSYWLRLVQFFMLDAGATKVVDITETTRERIQHQVNEGLANGDSVDEIANRLIGDDVWKSRGRVISRTEVGNASNMAAGAAARRSGLRLKKVWISSQDDRTRRRPRDEFDHLHADGQTVPLDEPFNISGELMMHPCAPGASAGNAVNCRCTTAHEADRDASGRLIRTPIRTAISV